MNSVCLIVVEILLERNLAPVPYILPLRVLLPVEEVEELTLIPEKSADQGSMRSEYERRPDFLVEPYEDLPYLVGVR
jgi:hypothetical protein